MDREGFRKMYMEKKGGELTPDDEDFIAHLTLRDVVKIWELIREEKDWEAEISLMKKKKSEGAGSPNKAKEDKEKAEREAKEKEEREAREREAREREEAIAREEAEKERKRKEEEEAERKRKEEEARIEKELMEEAERQAELELQQEAERQAAEELKRLEERRRAEEEEERRLMAEAEAEATREIEEEMRKLDEQMKAAPQEADNDEEVPAEAVPVVTESFAKDDHFQAAVEPEKPPPETKKDKYDLPENYKDLEKDPRTDLPLMKLPEIMHQVLFSTFGDNPLIHYAGHIEKANRNHKFEQRYMILTNYCIYQAHPKDGFVARSLEITDLKAIGYALPNVLLFIVPKEFDLLIRTETKEVAEKIIYICRTVYEYKRKISLPLISMTDEADVISKAQLKKPSYWRPDTKHVHSKEELWKRLKAMNDQDEALAYLNLKVDPRTNLPLIEIPKEHRHVFQSGPFQGDPLIHFFAPVDKVNHKLGIDKRFCLVTNSCIYLSYTNGNMQRCIVIHQISEIFTGMGSVGLKVPDEFDLYLKFPSKTDYANTLVETIRRVFKFKAQKDVPLSDLTPEAAVQGGRLLLKKPDTWRARLAPVLQRADLIDYLRKLGIKPEPESNTKSAV